jgi:hypothetical protein
MIVQKAQGFSRYKMAHTPYPNSFNRSMMKALQPKRLNDANQQEQAGLKQP